MADAKENDKGNITIGLPKPGGAIYVAPAGTELPTDADSPLAEGFVNLGYISEDGVTNTTGEETDEVKSWGNETVIVSQTSFSKTMVFNLLESARVAALQFVRGKDNVKTEEDGSIKSGETGETLPRCVIVVDTIQNNGSDKPRFHRMVFGDAQVTDRSGDQTYNNSDPVTYPVTVTAYKFASKALDGKMVFQDDFWSKTSEAV